MRIWTFDTTLRDGTQGEAISFSVDDKIQIAHKLDELGIDYIEGGWPMSNPKDKEFFERAKEIKLKHARLCAFGATRFARNPVEQDANVLALLEAETPAVSIFGKTWDLHVTRVLGITLEENKTGRKNFLAMREAARHQPVEVVGQELRAMMPFLKKKKEEGIPQEAQAETATKK